MQHKLMPNDLKFLQWLHFETGSNTEFFVKFKNPGIPSSTMGAIVVNLLQKGYILRRGKRGKADYAFTEKGLKVYEDTIT